MEIVWIVLSFLLMITGLLGCFIHRLPGPIITFAGILLMLNSSYKCNGIHINNLFKFFVWCEVSKSFTRSII